MKNSKVIIICAFLVLFSMFHVLPSFAADVSPSKQSRVLKSKIQKITKSVKLKKNKFSKLEKTIFSTDKKIESLSKKQFELEQKLRKTRLRLAGLEKEKKQLLASISTSNQNLSRLIRAFYILQRQQPLKVLLNQKDMGTVGRLKVYHDYLIRAYTNQSTRLQKQLNEMSTLDKTLSRRQLMLEELLQKNRQQTIQLQKSYKERQQTLAKLQSEIKSATSKIKRLKSDQKRLEKLAKAIAKLKLEKKSSGMSFAKKRGRLAWPVKGRVVQKFGRLRAGSKLKWRGVLIETQAGSEVRAVSKGEVVFADWLTGYGFVIILDHGRHYMSLYGHNQQLLLDVGDKVNENQLIALAGNSGRSGKPALYFEIRYKGKPVNPTKWIVARKSRR